MCFLGLLNYRVAMYVCLSWTIISPNLHWFLMLLDQEITMDSFPIFSPFFSRTKKKKITYTHTGYASPMLERKKFFLSMGKSIDFICLQIQSKMLKILLYPTFIRKLYKKTMVLTCVFLLYFLYPFLFVLCIISF